MTLEEYRSLKIGDEVILVGNVIKIGIYNKMLVKKQVVGVVMKSYLGRFHDVDRPWLVFFNTPSAFADKYIKEYIVTPPFLEKALHEKICPTCDGVGFIENSLACPTCQGQGITGL